MTLKLPGEGKFSDFCRALTGGRVQGQLVPDLICFTANVTERKVGAQRWRLHSAGDVADFLAGKEKFVAPGGQGG